MSLARSWERFRWRHPEWWSLGLSLFVWLLVLLPSGPTGAEFTAAAHQHHAHLAHAMFLPWSHIFSWILMVVAMMLPLVVHCIRVTASRSLWLRRDQAISVFLLGYLACWILAGVVISKVVSTVYIPQGLPSTVAVSVAFGLAAGWQLTGAKRRILRSCHRTIPIAPYGWRANLDCFRYGWMIGGNCLLSCGALMVACCLAGHSLPAMAGAGSISAAERYMASPHQRLLSIAILAIGFVCAFSRWF
jgi:Predicted metal-binding integral membrane protein (DUF2182)